MSNHSKNLIETLVGGRVKRLGALILTESTSRQETIISGEKHTPIAWVVDGSPHLGFMPTMLWDKLADWS